MRQTESLIPDFAPLNPGCRAAGQEKTPPGDGVRMGGSLQANPLPVWTEVWGGLNPEVQRGGVAALVFNVTSYQAT